MQEVYADRLARTRAMMKEQGIDGLYLTNMEEGHSEHIWWLTGFAGSSSCCLVTDSKLVLITDPRYENRAPKEIALSGSDLVIYRKPKEVIAEITRHRLNRLGVVKTMQLGIFDALEEKLLDTPTELVRVSKSAGPNAAKIDPLTDVQSIKEGREIDAIRIATETIEDALSHVMSHDVRVGVSELELVSALEDALPRGVPFSFPAIIGSGPNSAIAHYNVLDDPEAARTLQPGDTVQFDVGCVVGRYCSDIARVGVMGPFTASQLDMHRVVKEAMDASLELYRPGMSLRAAHMRASSVLESHGFPPLHHYHSLGHGVGMRGHELPYAAENIREDLVFEEGQVISCEPGIYIADEGGMRIERMVLITKDSPELLDTKLSDELFIF